ncbi:MAG: MaoC family dehydratase [Deltaproteobacteria bacterium]|nr:MaoC family dehydratase [Deltaproteobacteria bacterium]
MGKYRVGMAEESSKEITHSDLSLYCAVSGDFNPIHFDPVYAKRSRFKGPIAHGMISACFVSGLMAMKLPGPGTIYLSQTLHFLSPVRVGDVITARAEIIEILEKGRLRLKTTCRKRDGSLVLDGEAVVIKPKA